MQHWVLLGESVSLICGTALVSNPQAIISWVAPDGTRVLDNSRYKLENGPDTIRLNITHSVMNDTGIWQCEIKVESEVSNDDLILTGRTMIGTPLQHDIQLTVIGRYTIIVIIKLTFISTNFQQLLLVSLRLSSLKVVKLHHLKPVGLLLLRLSLPSCTTSSQCVI